MIDLKKLRELAISADLDKDWVTPLDISEFDSDDDKYFIAALSPVTVIQLLDQLEAAQKDAARYQFLKDGDWLSNEELEPVIRLQLNSLWDQKIDAAMSSQA